MHPNLFCYPIETTRVALHLLAHQPTAYFRRLLFEEVSCSCTPTLAAILRSARLFPRATLEGRTRDTCRRGVMLVLSRTTGRGLIVDRFKLPGL
jgi:hypothetical protein